MKAFKLLIVCSALVIIASTIGCDTGSGPGPSGVQTFTTMYQAGAYAGVGVGTIDPNVQLTFTSYNYGACSDPALGYHLTTDSNGNANISLSCLPGDVIITRASSSNCYNSGLPYEYSPAYIAIESSTYQLPCGLASFAPEFTPPSIDINTAPLSVAVQYATSVFTSTYGLPVVYYFDASGTFITSENVFSVSTDGTGVVIDTSPMLSSGIAGSYGLVFYNVASNGSLNPIAGAGFGVTDIIPPGGGGCGGDVCGDQP